jgi:transcriptional regulator with XRE-family HTH domain
MDVRRRFGSNVRRLRRQRGLSQEAFGLEADIDRTYVSGVERGARNPSLTAAQKFADGLGVPLWLLFTDSPDLPND